MDNDRRKLFFEEGISGNPLVVGLLMYLKLDTSWVDGVYNQFYHDSYGVHDCWCDRGQDGTITYQIDASAYLPTDGDAVKIPIVNDSLDFGGVSDSAFSISLWNKATVMGAWGRVMINKQSLTNRDWEVFGDTSGYMYFRIFDGTASNYLEAKSDSPAISLGQFNQVVVTYDGSENASGLKIYINKVLIVTTNIEVGTYTGMVNSHYEVHIGDRGYDTRARNGWFDDVKIWGRELTQEDITLDFDTGDINLPLDLSEFSAPSAITDVTHNSVQDTAINLTWSIPTSDLNILYYDIYVDTIFESRSYGNSKFVTGLTNLQTYDFTVKAINKNLQESAVSNTYNKQINGSSTTYLGSLLGYFNFNNNCNCGVSEIPSILSLITYSAGQSGNAVDFDGLRSALHVFDDDIFTFTSGGGVDTPFSICSYIQSNITTNQMLIGKRSLDSNTREWYIVYVSQQIRLLMESSGGNYILAFTTGTIDISTLKHITVTYDGTKAASGIKMYVNGGSEAMTTSSGGTYVGMADKDLKTVIGTDGASIGTLNWDGIIDGLSVFSKELTPTEITAIYGVQSGGDELI